jgi:hypothetical protein
VTVLKCAAGCGEELTSWHTGEDGRRWHPECVPPGTPLADARPRTPDRQSSALAALLAVVDADTVEVHGDFL